MAKTRRVVIYEDYLDGIMGLDVREPTDYDPEVMVVDVQLLQEHEEAKAALHAVEERLRAAWVSAPRRKNPTYVAEEDL